MKVLAIVLLLCISLLGTETGSLLIRTGGPDDFVRINDTELQAEDSLLFLDFLDTGWYKITAPDGAGWKSTLVKVTPDSDETVVFQRNLKRMYVLLTPTMYGGLFIPNYKNILIAQWHIGGMVRKSRLCILGELTFLDQKSEAYLAGMIKLHKNFLLPKGFQIQTGMSGGWIGWKKEESEEFDFVVSSVDSEFLWGWHFFNVKLGYNFMFGSTIAHKVYGGVLFRI